MSKFYTFVQNNSGGYNIINDFVAKNLIIEAESEGEAIMKMYEITLDYSEYCECCGERWDQYFEERLEPMVWGVKVLEERPSSPFDQATIIYYMNGEVKKLWYEGEQECELY